MQPHPLKLALVALGLFAWGGLRTAEARTGTAIRSVEPGRRRLERPNVVFVRTDDETASAMGVRKADGAFVMQHVLDDIANQGVSFTNSFVSFSLCSPSRATFLTGQYAHHHHVIANAGAHGGYAALDHSNTLAVWEARNGYYTCHVGKYLNSYTGGIAPGWNEWYTSFVSHYFDYDVNENGTVVHYGNADGDYVTDVETDQAVEFIRARNYGSRPFFLVVDYTAPHGTSPAVPGIGIFPVPAPWYGAVFADFAPHWPPNFDERNVSDKPPFVQALPLLDRDAVGQVIADERAVYGTLLSVDEGVARIVAALDANGMLDNTFIFFTSDNGIERGEHRLTDGKDHLYEESIRVPLLVRGPGVRRNVTVDSVVANIDYAPTIAELTGATANLAMDGISLVPALTGEGAISRDGILLESYDGTTQTPVGLRTRDYAFAEYADGFVELYALASDPYEMQNVAYQPEFADTVAALHIRVQRLRQP